MKKIIIPINPRLPKHFENFDNDYRPESHERWFFRPFIKTTKWEDFSEMARKDEKFKETWFTAWPDGIRYDVRCLDGGAWDRSTNYGSFARKDLAMICAINLHINYIEARIEKRRLDR